MSINVTLIFFASLREIVGVKKLTLNFSEQINLSDLKKILVLQYPELVNHIDYALFSINQEFAFDKDMIVDGAEIAIFPPVSGGKEDYPTICLVTDQEIEMDKFVSRITSEGTGAVCVFIGKVRAFTKTKVTVATSYLEYEAYELMAVNKMTEISKEIRNRWPEVQGIVLVQRIGTLLPGTSTVLVACSSAHRKDGIFEAAHYGIDRLKQIVPIWKKEIGPNHGFWVEGDYYPQPGK